jgi:nicotinate-nucleotide adenylyltransferase
LGGSFNPAHGGHLQLSLLALERLDLDEVWWLVSPQNPLKPVAGMAPFAVRLGQARQVATRHRRIIVSDLESRLGRSTYTADTLHALRRRFPRLRFVWLMGADNLVQLRHWQRWSEIFRTVAIAVFDRPSYSLKALAGLPAKRFARQRVPPLAARRLAEMNPPAWVFFHSRLELVLKELEDGKAEDVITIELAGKTTIADQMVIASGRSTRQVLALAEHLEEALSRRMRISVEGKTQGDWVLIDASDVIVHLFRPEVRSYYNLEKMWGEALPDSAAARQ